MTVRPELTTLWLSITRRNLLSRAGVKLILHPNVNVSIQELLFVLYPNYSSYVKHRSSQINSNFCVLHPSLMYWQLLEFAFFFLHFAVICKVINPI